MTAALWLLMKLRLRGWGRRMRRQVQTVKGALLTAFFGFFILLYFGGMIANAIFLPRAAGASAPPEYVHRFGPLVLLAYCVLMILSSGAGAPLNFTPPEVQFLFAGPFSRRQILTYKILSQFLLTLPICVFMTFAARSLSGSALSAFVAALLVFNFLQLFGLAVNFVACTMGELAYSRGRRVVLLLLVVAALAAAFLGWRAAGGLDDPLETLKRVEESAVVQYGLSPLRWYAQVLTATTIDADALLHAAGALGINLALLLLIYGLDASYLESAAANSEKRYARLEKMRRGGLTALGSTKTAPVRYRVPDPPWLGGIGPIAWRQLLSAVRSHRVMTVIVIATLLGCIGPVIAAFTAKKADDSLPWLLAGMGLFMSMLLNQALAFDFRSDVDRMEVLKTLPIPAWRIAVGQLVAPVLCSCLYQIMLVGVVYMVFGKIGVLLAFTAVMCWPVNLLLVGIDNLLFLLFPTRMGPATPGDFSHAGRQMLLFLGKGIGLIVGLGLPATFAAVVHTLSDGNWPLTILAAFLPATLICALPIPLVSLAFSRYDVTRDTPP